MKLPPSLNDILIALGTLAALAFFGIKVYNTGYDAAHVRQQIIIDDVLRREASLIVSMNSKIQNLELHSSRLATDLVLSRTVSSAKQSELVAEYLANYSTIDEHCSAAISELSSSFINRMIQVTEVPR